MAYSMSKMVEQQAARSQKWEQGARNVRKAGRSLGLEDRDLDSGACECTGSDVEKMVARSYGFLPAVPRMVLLFSFAVLLVMGHWVAPVQGQKQGAATEGETVEGFEIQDYHEDGSLKSVLKAGTAVIRPAQQLVDINDLTINFFDKKTREIEMVVKSPKCLYSTGRKRAISEESVSIVRENLKVTGVGFEWQDNIEKKEFVIKSKARVELKNMDKTAVEGKKPDENK